MLCKCSSLSHFSTLSHHFTQDKSLLSEEVEEIKVRVTKNSLSHSLIHSLKEVFSKCSMHILSHTHPQTVDERFIKLEYCVNEHTK